MKIISMHIYGFGQLADVTIDNLADFQIFYGENEAGKSTIMAFIHGILFGFPTKQQSELRYEPKHNSSYGGKLKLFIEEIGSTVIERVKGKAAAGDVTVTTDNGIIGGEELLKKLLSKVDRGLFQSIFSFNLHGLQNIHQMKGEEIGRFLFSAGTLGTDRLSFADSVLQKELDSRFKPGGKKPLINVKLQSLNHLNRELKAAAGKNQEYGALVQQKNAIQNEMADMIERIRRIEDEVNKLKEWQKIEPIVKELKWTEQELSQIGEFSFPLRGIERYEQLQPLIASSDARIVSLKDRISRLNQELDTIKPNMLFLEKESEIQAVLEKYPLYQQLELEEKQTEIKLRQYEEKLAEKKEKLHISLTEEEILSINTDIFMKDLAEKLSKRSQALEEIKLQLENRFNEEKNELEKIEENIRFHEEKVIPDLERSKLEQQVNEGLLRNNVEMKLQTVRDKIEIYNKSEQKEKREKARLNQQKRMQYLLFLLLFFGLAFYGIYSGQTVPLLLGAAGFIGVLFFWMLNLRQPLNRSDMQSGLAELLEEEQYLLRQFKTADVQKMVELQSKLSLDNRHREQMQVLRIKLEQQQIQYEKVIKLFENWELDAAEHKKEINKISCQLKIPENIAASFLLEAFAMIEQYKSATREVLQLQEGLKVLQESQKDVLEQLQLFAEEFLDKRNADLQTAANLLKNQLKAEQEKSIQWKEKHTKLTDLEAELQQLSEEQQHLQDEINQLIQSANVEDETEFYELGAKTEKKERLLERQEYLELQLHYSILSELERESFLQIHDSDEIIGRHCQEIEGLQSGLTRLQEQQASILYQIQMLEEGGLYAELLHQFKEKKFELEEDAKDWAVYSLAQSILTKTVEKYKNVHLPRMLSKAEEFLSFLTEGNYQKLLLNQTGQGFLIVRKDQTIFEANELSQSTTEQVYVAIRLALAVTIYENYRFPIIIDDSFVNFDRKRTQRTIELLKQFKQNQLLFFTCHEHLLEYFDAENILFLKKGAIHLL